MSEMNFKKVGQTFQVAMTKEGAWWYVFAPGTPVASQGQTEEEALFMIKDALELGFEISGVEVENITNTPEGQTAIQKELADLAQVDY